MGTKYTIQVAADFYVGPAQAIFAEYLAILHLTPNLIFDNWKRIKSWQINS